MHLVDHAHSARAQPAHDAKALGAGEMLVGRDAEPAGPADARETSPPAGGRPAGASRPTEARDRSRRRDPGRPRARTAPAAAPRRRPPAGADAGRGSGPSADLPCGGSRRQQNDRQLASPSVAILLQRSNGVGPNRRQAANGRLSRARAGSTIASRRFSQMMAEKVNRARLVFESRAPHTPRAGERAMVVEVNGIELNYETTGDGEPLLWLHGFMGSGADWKYIFGEPPAGFPADRARPARPRRLDESIRRVLLPPGGGRRAALLRHSVSRVKAIGVSGGGITCSTWPRPLPHASSRWSSSARRLTSPRRRGRSSGRPPSRCGRRGDGHDAEAASSGRGRRFSSCSRRAALCRGVRRRELHAAVARHNRGQTLIVFGDRDPLYPVSLAFELNRRFRDRISGWSQTRAMVRSSATTRRIRRDRAVVPARRLGECPDRIIRGVCPEPQRPDGKARTTNAQKTTRSATTEGT